MKIGIIGYGVVGKAAEATFARCYKVFKYDKFKDYDSFESLKKCDFVFIMVPTPFNYETNLSDDSSVIVSLQKLQDLGYSNTIIIKSTLLPGSCARYTSMFDLEIVYNPEFLRERTNPYEDFQMQKTVVIGTSKTKIFNDIKNMYKRVCVPKAAYFMVSPLEAEMIKLSQNTMLGSRVAIANMIYDACNAHGVDYNTIRQFAFDPFEILGPHMVQVPGPDGKRGFGGKCLPKDVMGFYSIHHSRLLKEILSYNKSLRDDLED